MKKYLAMLLAVSLLLSGCGFAGKKYVSVQPHREQKQNNRNEAATAANSLDLIRVLETMILDGTENGIIYLTEYPAANVLGGMEVAAGYAMTVYPLGAYVVENIDYEVGTTGGVPAMAVNISYRYSDAHIRQIRDIVQMDEARALVAAALEDCDTRLVMRAEMYFETDFQQMVRDYALTYPERVMEIPVVTEGIYGNGPGRVVELTFTYQNGRDALRQMQAQVEPVFEAAELYVAGNAGQRQKYSQLYAFLMERFDYKMETSITPAYSLLHHGVGDSRAFATVYAAMCRRAGLECMVVTGTRAGEPWVWNIIRLGDTYQHVDLHSCNLQGWFQERADGEMEGYVWDYSAYPECPVIRPQEPAEAPVSGKQPEAEESLPEQEETVPETVPETQIPERDLPPEPSVPIETGSGKTAEENFEEI